MHRPPRSQTRGLDCSAAIQGWTGWPVKFWQAVSFTEPEQLVDLARIAEDVGFHGIFVSDHLFVPRELHSAYPYSADGVPAFGPETPWTDPWASIAAMAAVTRRLQFSTLIYILPARHPVEVAKAAATVDVLSGGRFALGAGAGWMKEEFDVLGVPFRRRGKRFDESIEVLRKLWRGGMVEHEGEFFSFPALQMSPAPTRPIPVYVGGVSEPALRRAARLGDGWLGAGNAPDEAAAVLARLDQLRGEAGREREPFEACVPLAGPPEPDAIRVIEDAGATSTVSYPISMTLGGPTSLDEKRRYLEEYARNVIDRCR